MHPRQLPPTRLLLFHKILWSNFSSRASDEIQQLEHCLYCSSPWYLSRLHEHHPDSMTAHVALLPTMKSHKINNCWLLNLFHAQCDFVLCFNLHLSVWSLQRQILRVAARHKRKTFHSISQRWKRRYVQQCSETHSPCYETTHTVQHTFMGLLVAILLLKLVPRNVCTASEYQSFKTCFLGVWCFHRWNRF